MNDQIDTFLKHSEERDRAVGALLLLAYDGVISEGRARELLGMDIHQVRAETARAIREGGEAMARDMAGDDKLTAADRAKIERGMQQSRDGEVVVRSFAEYAVEDEDEHWFTARGDGQTRVRYDYDLLERMHKQEAWTDDQERHFQVGFGAGYESARDHLRRNGALARTDPAALQLLLADVCQVLDGWHADEAWTAWDESVRLRISQLMRTHKETP